MSASYHDFKSTELLALTNFVIAAQSDSDRLQVINLYHPGSLAKIMLRAACFETHIPLCYAWCCLKYEQCDLMGLTLRWSEP